MPERTFYCFFKKQILIVLLKYLLSIFIVRYWSFCHRVETLNIPSTIAVGTDSYIQFSVKTDETLRKLVLVQEGEHAVLRTWEDRN